MSGIYYQTVMPDGQWPSIPEVFNQSAVRFPERTAFSCFEGSDKHTYTYRQIADQIRIVGMYLKDKGVKEGDRILLIGKNSPAWATGYLSIQAIGAVVVPLDVFSTPEKVNALGLFSEVSAMLADEQWLVRMKGTPLYDTLTVRLSLESTVDDAHSLWNLPNGDTNERLPAIDSSSLAAILYTSGTTGNEKGVMLTHANLISDAYQASDPQFLSLDETDVFYGLLPLHHSYAMTAVFLESILHGSELLFTPKVLISRNITEMSEGHVTNILGIPLLYNKIREGVLKKVKAKGAVAYTVISVLLFLSLTLSRIGIPAGRKWFSSILAQIGFADNRLAICGGGPLSPQVVNFYRALGITFLQGYGLTETSPIITLNPRRKIRPASVGIPFPLVDLRISDPDLLGVGEIQVKGPNITGGYYKDETATRELFTEDGYLKTGDLGSIDRKGYVYIQGRAKNLIVTEGGKNVYPEQIEEQILLHAEIEQAVVRMYVGNKSTRSEQIEALIYCDPQNNVSEQMIHSIIDEVNRRVHPYERISRTTILTEPMEMTSTRKIKRTKVQRTLDRLKG
ncbi:MAG: AMP-binding protein [Sphaerochaetaceae bacterium]|nr:AMP-binding protein [Sphaerochaetaceae bacterium]